MQDTYQINKQNNNNCVFYVAFKGYEGGKVEKCFIRRRRLYCAIKNL